ncbi:MAG: hypothetical protein O2944_09055 [Proteobacteria bacterium]|nr:hypothetical protein [Pseudomonadota bacterium]
MKINTLTTAGALALGVLAGTVQTSAAGDVQIAQAARAANSTLLQLGVEATCEDGNAIFKVTNLGAEWPKAGRLSIVYVEGTKIISKRNMRMTNGQNASFRVPASKIGAGEYQISVEPTWYDRGRIIDGRVACK